MLKFDYDMIVIGAGAAGLTAAIGASKIGARVLLVEGEKYGGDCTHYGCVPSKSLIHAAEVAYATQKREACGLSKKRVEKIDLKKVLAATQETVDHIEEKFDSEEVLNGHGVETLTGLARFYDENTISVSLEGGDEKKLTAKKFVIATGARPRMLDDKLVKDVELLTNRTIFEPRSMASLTIIGSGPIGVELAQAFSRLGVEVTIMTRDQKIISRESEDAQKILTNTLREEGVTIITEASITKIAKKASGAEVCYATPKKKKATLTSEHVLVAIGRTPNVEGLGLEEIGVEYDTGRGISVDPRGQTTVRHIYAVGDVASQWKFTHYANHMAKVMLARSIFHLPFGAVEEEVIPRVTFTSPEVASVGLTSDMIADQQEHYHLLRKSYDDVDRAITDRDTQGHIEIVVNKRGRIVGATLVGKGAGEMINELALAMKQKIPITRLADTIHAYPTYGYGLRNCADQFRGLSYTAEKRQWVQKILGLRGK